MDGDLALIMGMIVTVSAIIGTSAYAITAKVYAHKRWERENSLIGSQSSSRVSQIAERTDMIEDRLRVLERLATDRGTLLSDEIEKLRDERSARREKEAG